MTFLLRPYHLDEGEQRQVRQVRLGFSDQPVRADREALRTGRDEGDFLEARVREPRPDLSRHVGLPAMPCPNDRRAARTEHGHRSYCPLEVVVADVAEYSARQHGSGPALLGGRSCSPRPSAVAQPTHDAGGGADREDVCFQVFGDDRAGADDSVLADAHARADDDAAPQLDVVHDSDGLG